MSPSSQASGRRVLIVSPHFPPVNAPDHQRVRTSLPHYAEFGWKPEVLAVAPQHVEARLDRELLTTIPAELPVHRCGAWPAALTRLVGLGNLAYRSRGRMQAMGSELLRTGQFDLVYFSTTQFIATTLGEVWRKKFGVPYVIDIQDPWRTDYYERPGAPPPPGGWKYRIARRQAARLEEPSWRHAAGFVSVSPGYLDQLRGRYPWFAAKPAAVIPFGAAPADFRKAREAFDLRPGIPLEPGTLCCASVGAVGPIMREALEQLFSAVRRLRTEDPALVARLRFHFVGTSYAPAGRATPSVLPVAEAFGVADLVREETGRVEYFTALRTMLEADALIVPSSLDPDYSPSKLAGCFLAEKPVLSLAPAGSALERLAGELGIGPVATIPGVDRVTDDFLRALVTGRTGPLLAGRRTDQFEEVHSARARTREQCALFDRCLEASPPRA
jgi:glycosyltransferase involved in cell wall biosynthesis